MLAVPPLPPEFPPNVPHRCVSDPMYRRLKKGRTSQQRISDPGFFDADHIPHGQLEGHLMMQQFTTSEELALFAEIRAFWQSYDLLKNRRRTRDWTAKTRQHCIKGYQEGMIAAREFPSSMAGDWGSGFRTASYGRELDMLVETLPWEFMAGLEAGTRNFASYPFGEQAAKAYGDCFGAAFEAKEMFMTDKHPESISRGALNGLVVADCVRGFEQKVRFYNIPIHIQIHTSSSCSSQLASNPTSSARFVCKKSNHNTDDGLVETTSIRDIYSPTRR